VVDPDTPVSEPQISGGTVLIEAAAASVNPIDWKVRSGMRQKDFPLSFPAILGCDVSGVVRAVGTYVKHFKPGDRVLALSNATYAEAALPGVRAAREKLRLKHQSRTNVLLLPAGAGSPSD
jgi:NADPH:quinone reductase-like Zn-dependent oxidoreductase